MIILHSGPVNASPASPGRPQPRLLLSCRGAAELRASSWGSCTRAANSAGARGVRPRCAAGTGQRPAGYLVFYSWHRRLLQLQDSRSTGTAMPTQGSSLSSCQGKSRSKGNRGVPGQATGKSPPGGVVLHVAL